MKVAIFLGSDSDFEVDRGRPGRPQGVRRPLPAGGHLGPPVARADPPPRAGSRGRRGGGLHRRGGQGGPPGRRRRGPHCPARHRGPGRERGPGRLGRPPLDGPDAQGHPGGDRGPRQARRDRTPPSSRSRSWPSATRGSARSSSPTGPRWPRGSRKARGSSKKRYDLRLHPQLRLPRQPGRSLRLGRGTFEERGLRLAEDWARSDLVLVNTCTLTDRADRDVRRFFRAWPASVPASGSS